MKARTFALALSLALPSLLAAQQVEGELVEAGSGAPVPAARVQLEDEAGRTVASTLTDPAGHFSLDAPAPGGYRLRAERIGFLPTVGEPFRLEPGAPLRQRLEAAGGRVLLDAVVVDARARCDTRGASPEVATVWEEARKALDEVRATTAQAELAYTVELFDRELDAGTGAVRTESRRSVEGMMERPFVALDAEVLSASGFVFTAGDTTVYGAPDAEILLSEHFLEEHCFRLQSGTGAGAERVGLAFEPVRERRLPGVRGVLWVDRASSELRYLEYEYTRAPVRGPRGVPGGRLEFQRLPTGAWIISSWVIRMPVQGPTRMGYGAEVRPVVAVRETGGAVRSLQPRSTLLARGGPAAPSASAASRTPSPEAASPAPAARVEAAPAPPTRGPSATDRRRVIAREEVEGSRAASAYDLVQALRPQWLRTRGSDQIRAGSVDLRGGAAPMFSDASPISLFVDGGRVGTVDDLRTIATGDVERVEYYDAVEAQQRWGRGHAQGAIQVLTRRGR